jgi:ABC-type spermidine/putrescine transport system permease subunit II
MSAWQRSFLTAGIKALPELLIAIAVAVAAYQYRDVDGTTYLGIVFGWIVFTMAMVWWGLQFLKQYNQAKLHQGADGRGAE